MKHPFRSGTARAGAATGSRWRGACWLLPAGVALTGCGGRAEDLADATLPAQACRPELAPRVFQHACQHAGLGPYRDLSVSPDEGALALDVSRAHTTFRVSAEGPSDGAPVRLAYHPSREGEHVFFTAASFGLHVRDAAGSPLVAVHSEEGVPCDVLESAAIYELTPGEPYELDVTLPGEGALTLFIEHLGTFRAPWEEDCE